MEKKDYDVSELLKQCFEMFMDEKNRYNLDVLEEDKEQVTSNNNSDTDHILHI